jgi:hypothetical protein
LDAGAGAGFGFGLDLPRVRSNPASDCSNFFSISLRDLDFSADA